MSGGTKSEWREVSLAEIYEFGSGLSKPRSEFGSGHPFLSFKDVFYNSAVPKRLTELANTTEQERARCSVKRGDVFLTRTSETMEELGMSSVALADIPDATFNGFTKRLRPKQERVIAPEFARYFFRSWSFRVAVNAMSSMSTRASLNNEMLERLTISFPPFEEQTAIGSILGTLDDKIELNRKQNETLEAMARALFKAWFVDFEPVRAKLEGRWQRGQSLPGLPVHLYDLFPDRLVESALGEIPEGWRVETFGSHVEIKRGGSPRPIHDFLADEGLRWLKISDVTSLQTPFVLEIKEHIKEAGLNKTVFLKSGSLVLSNSATPGIPKFLCVDTCIHDGWLYFPKSKFSNEFMYLFFTYIRPNLVSLGNGSVFTNLKTDIIKNLSLIVPDDANLAKFDDIIKPIFQRLEKLAKESSSLAQLRDTMLPKLISGELRVPDAQSFLRERGL